MKAKPAPKAKAKAKAPNPEKKGPQTPPPNEAPPPFPQEPPTQILPTSRELWNIFNTKLAEIGAGRRSRREDLYEPTTPYRKERHLAIGKIASAHTRELLSFSLSLLARKMAIPYPRKSEDRDSSHRCRTVLDMQHKIASGVFRARLLEEFPELLEVDEAFQIIAGWNIVTLTDEDKRHHGNGSVSDQEAFHSFVEDLLRHNESVSSE
jgi:hypothetical protein